MNAGALADPRHRRGRDAERLACSFLRARGLTLVERNWHCRAGELDLVMLDDGILVVVEVRCRLGRPPPDAAASVSPRKRKKLRAAAAAYLARSGLGDSLPVRLDLVAIGGPAAAPAIRWYRNFCRG